MLGFAGSFYSHNIIHFFKKVQNLFHKIQTLYLRSSKEMIIDCLFSDKLGSTVFATVKMDFVGNIKVSAHVFQNWFTDQQNELLRNYSVKVAVKMVHKMLHPSNVIYDLAFNRSSGRHLLYK